MTHFLSSGLNEKGAMSYSGDGIFYLKLTYKMHKNNDEMIRVNHAGEYGATRIYAGQLFVLGDDFTISHMAKQEAEHLHNFQRMLVERRVRPSLLQPFWYIGGFMMGALTAAMGRNVAHACTAAVETVIDAHYSDQPIRLEKDGVIETTHDAELVDLITQCHADECAHRQIAERESGVNLAATYPILTGVIKAITATAIKVAKRV